MSGFFSSPSRAGQPVGGLSNRLFAAAMLAFVVLFVGGWLALFAADVAYTSWDAVGQVLRAKEIRAALRLSLARRRWKSTPRMGMSPSRGT